MCRPLWGGEKTFDDSFSVLLLLDNKYPSVILRRLNIYILKRRVHIVLILKESVTE